MQRQRYATTSPDLRGDDPWNTSDPWTPPHGVGEADATGSVDTDEFEVIDDDESSWSHASWKPGTAGNWTGGPNSRNWWWSANRWQKSGWYSDSASRGDCWTPAQGPQEGVRWLAGPAPFPPKMNAKDLESFLVWEQHLEAWRYRVLKHVPEEEAAIILWESLEGEAAKTLL